MSLDERRLDETPSDNNGLVAILVELSRAAEQPVERHTARRMLIEAQSVWPGEFADQWWKWLIEAGQSLGLSLRATEAHFINAVDLAGSHIAAATAWGPGETNWLVLADGYGARTAYIDGRHEQTLRWAKTTTVLKRFSQDPFHQPLRWVVAEQRRVVESESHGKHLTPWKRLWKLLAPESGDLWVVVVIALFIGLLATAVPVAGQQLVRTVTFGALYQPIIILSLVLFGFLSFMAVLQILTIFVAEMVQRRLFARLVADFSYRLPRASLTSIEPNYSPELANRFFDVMTVQKVVAGLLVDGIALVLTTVVGMALLAFYHPFLLGYDVVLLTLMLLVIFLVGRGGTSAAIRESSAKFQMGAWLQDVGRCFLSFKLYGAADFSVDRADRLAAKYLTARQQHFRVLMRQFLCIFSLQALASTILLGLGGYLVVTEQLSLGQLVAAELVISNIVGSFAKLTKHIETFYDLMAAVDKLGYLIDIRTEPQQGLMSLPTKSAAHLEVRRLAVTTPTVIDKHSSGEKPVALDVFHNLSFDVAQGASLAIVGPPGCGKSLLLDTLFELRAPHAGSVMLDGVDPTDLRPDVLRRHMVMIRDVEILEGSIAENIHFNRADIDTLRVREALALVGLADELHSLPSGLDTHLSTSGRPLTDSQTRRLMLARMVAGHPRVLLIDGTLDGLSDDLLEDVWSRLQGWEFRPTIIVTTGRRSLMDACDRVLEIPSISPVSKGTADQSVASEDVTENKSAADRTPDKGTDRFHHHRSSPPIS